MSNKENDIHQENLAVTLAEILCETRDNPGLSIAIIAETISGIFDEAEIKSLIRELKK